MEEQLNKQIKRTATIGATVRMLTPNWML